MRRDINFSFQMHPLNRDLAVKTGSSAIKQSLINLVRTNFGDRGYNMEVGTNTDASLFENITLLTAQQLQTNIENTIRNFEPQVELVEVIVSEGLTDNEITVTITYNELNSVDEQTLQIGLSTIR